VNKMNINIINFSSKIGMVLIL